MTSIRLSCFMPASIRGPSSSRFLMTLRILSTSGEIFSKYANSRHGSGPLLYNFAGAAVLSLSKSASVQYFFCEFRVGFFFSISFFFFSIIGSLLVSGIWSNFSFHLMIRTSSSCGSA